MICISTAHPKWLRKKRIEMEFISLQLMRECIQKVNGEKREITVRSGLRAHTESNSEFLESDFIICTSHTKNKILKNKI